MKRYYISYNEVRNNAIKISHVIASHGFIPDIIYVNLRGGAYTGNVISEYFKIVTACAPSPVFYAAVVARSYQADKQMRDIIIDGWTYHPDRLNPRDKVMIVDDIYDSGRTMQHMVEIIRDRGIPRENIKVVVHDYKIREYGKKLKVIPDYYCRKFSVNNPENDFWIHYLSHELENLSERDIIQHYPPQLHDILIDLIKQSTKE